MAEEQGEGQEKVDAQKQYLMAKINELIEGVGPGYSEALMEELITRMDRTVAHFHEEVSDLLEVLKSRAKERDEKLKSLLTGHEEVSTTKPEEQPAETVSAAEQEISEWEKKLEAKEKDTGTAESTKTGETAPEAKPEKKGLFKRR